MALQITLNGIDYTDVIAFKSIQTQESMEVKGCTMSFTAYIYSHSIGVIESGMEIIFTDSTVREFAGVVIEVQREPAEGLKLVIYTVICNDYTFYLDRRYVNDVYVSQAADAMVKLILDDLQTAANSDSDAGDAHYDDFQGNKTQIEVGPTIKQQPFERILPSQALEVIAESSGMQWFMDFNKRVNLKEVSSIFSPLPIPSGRVLGTLLIETELEHYYDFKYNDSIVGVGTKSILSNTLIRSTSTTTDNPQWNTGDSLTIFLSRRPFSLADITSVKANAVTLTQKLEDVDLERSDAVTSGEVAVYIGPKDKPGSSYVRLAAADIANGQIVEIIYNYGFSDDHEGIDVEGFIDELARRTGGDGIHEFVLSQISGIEVTSQVDLDEISDIILDRKAKPLITGEFRTLMKGTSPNDNWRAAQTFEIVWPREAIDIQVYVINVRKSVRTPADDPNISDNVIESRVQFSNIPRGVRL